MKILILITLFVSSIFARNEIVLDPALSMRFENKEYTEIINHCSQFNESGCNFFIGKIYLNGLDVQKNYIKAISYLEKSKGIDDANMLLGLIYENGLGIEKNLNKAFSYMSSAAILEDHNESLFHLGRYYENGIGTKRDYTLAIIKYERAAQLGNLEAKIRLANIYFDGEITKKNEEKSFLYFKEIERILPNDIDTLFHLIYFYSHGFGSDFNHVKIQILKYRLEQLKFNQNIQK